MMDGVLSPLNDLSEGGELDSNDNKLSKKIKALQTVALTCASALGSNLPLFSEITNLSVQPIEGKKTNKNKKVEILEEIIPFDVVCKSVARALCGNNSDINYHILHRIGIQFLYEFHGVSIDRMKAIAFISLLDKVSLHISENNNENNDKKALQNCLSLLSTLIINYIKISDINNTPIPESIIFTLTNVIQRSSGAGLSGVCNQPMTISGYFFYLCLIGCSLRFTCRGYAFFNT
jgi:hypothetical protein